MDALTLTFKIQTQKVEMAQEKLDAARGFRNAAINHEVRRRLTLSGLSLRKFADAIGITAPYLSDLLRDNRHWNDETVAKVEKRFPARSLQKETK